MRDVSKDYGRGPVLTDINFDVTTGAKVVITGRSGSGKSTLFKLLAGIDHPTTGTIQIDGEPIDGLDDQAASALRLHRLGLVFQAHNLLPNLTVQDNVVLPMTIAGRTRKDANARAQELLALVDMSDHADQKPNAISGGQAQRAAVARALANDPALLLADEPTGSLDAPNARRIMELFDRVRDELGTTTIIVTHDPIIMEWGATRMHIEGGRLIVRDDGDDAKPVAHEIVGAGE